MTDVLTLTDGPWKAATSDDAAAASAWTERHRPRRFADVAGLGPARDILQGELRARRGRSVLLHGPHGCGKTTLAGIYAAALLCGSGEEPCLRPDCPICSGGWLRETNGLTRWTAGTKDDAGMASRIVRELALGYAAQDRAVIVIEEADRLDADTASILHHLAEHADSVTIIACTRTAAAVPNRFARLLHPIAVPRADVIERVALLARICTREALAAEPGALERLARCADGGLRGLVCDLEALAVGGTLTRERVNAFYGFDGERPLACYLAALLDGRDLSVQAGYLAAWDAAPGAKAHAVARALGEAFVATLGGTEAGALWVERAQEHAALVAGLTWRAAARAEPPRALWEAVLRIWEGTAGLDTEAALLGRLSACDRLMNGGASVDRDGIAARSAHNSAPIPSRAQSTVPRGSGARLDRLPRRRRTPVDRDEAHLGWADACHLLDAASFLVQAHGLCLNTRFTIRYHPLGLAGDGAISDLVVRLGRGLLKRYRDARGERPRQVQLLYVHGTDPRTGPSTRFVATLPASGEEAERWLRHRFLPRQGGRGADGALDFYHEPTPTDDDGRAMAAHLACLRWLCAGLDPAAPSGRPGGDAAALIDALEIPESARYRPGPRPTTQRCGVSRPIDEGARRSFADDGVPILYATTLGRPAALCAGWELREFHYRQSFLRDRPDRETWEDGLLLRCTSEQRAALEAEFVAITETWKAGGPGRRLGRPMHALDVPDLA